MGICSVWLFFPLFSFSSGSFTLKRGQPQAEVQSLRSLGSPAMLLPRPHLTFFQAPSPRRPPRRASHVRAQLILSPLLPLWAPSLKLLFSYAVSRSHPASSYQTHGDCVLDPQDTRPVLCADPPGEQVVAVVSLLSAGAFQRSDPLTIVKLQKADGDGLGSRRSRSRYESSSSIWLVVAWSLAWVQILALPFFFFF